MELPGRRWAIVLGVLAVLLLSAAGVLLRTTSQEDGANIGAGIIGILVLACALGSMFIGLWLGIARWQARD